MYKNSRNISISMAVMLASDSYDHNDANNHISVTTLIKPLKQIIMSTRVKDDSPTEIMENYSSTIGTALHDALENAWTNNLDVTLKSLGYPDNLIKRIVVNPEQADLTPDTIPIYLENRTDKTVGNWVVSGKYDMVVEGRVEDLKSTGTFTYVNKSKDEDYILQGSMYRWLNPEIITDDFINIQFMFLDWNAFKGKSDPNYPASKLLTHTLPLKSVEETDNWVANKLKLIEVNYDLPEKDIPPCTDKDLWRREDVYKYYKNPKSTGRSTKNFAIASDAYIRLADDGNVGKVVKVPGEAVACKYCNAFSICEQKDALILDGSLKL